MPDEHVPEPPPPPRLPRRFTLYPFQWIGFALLAVFPVLAAAGVFGESWQEVRVAGGSLDVAVRFPDRYRYKQLNSVTVQVANAGPRTLDTVTVSLDTALANRFSTVRAIPAFARAYDAEVTGLHPGESRLVVIELQAEEYGRHAGTLTLRADDVLRVPLSIRIFP